MLAISGTKIGNKSIRQGNCKISDSSRLPKVLKAKKLKIINSKKPQFSSPQSLPNIKTINIKTLTLLEMALNLLSITDKYSGAEDVKIRFNHYNKKIRLHNRVLRWKDVDEEYCISFVYKGNYQRNIYIKSTESSEGKVYAKRDEEGKYFIEMDPNLEYFLEVIEDPVAGVGAEGLRLNSGPIKPLSVINQKVNLSGSLEKVVSGNRAVDDITNQLKSMASGHLNSFEANELKERRDIEDILFS